MSSPSVANRGSAEECVSKARAAGKAGDLAKALRLLDKSMRLFATDEARVLHAAYSLRLERQKEMPASSSSSQSNAKEKAAKTHGPVKGSYSADEQKLASNILKTEGYYERLGVAKNASQDEIKKAYRKKAFKFHPDKNHAPSAGDAFKALNEAYECLSNLEKKAIYDQYGTEQAPSPHYRNGADPFGGGFHEQQEFTPEDILNMFFNGNARMRRRQHAQHPRPAHAPASSYAQLFQFVPLLLMILFSMWSGPTSDEKPFRLVHDRTYSVERQTPSGTPYFVNSDFVRWYTRDRRALARVEELVEASHMLRLRELCKSEKKKRARAIYTAKKSNAGNQNEILQSAYSMAMPSCTRLEGIYSQG